MKILYFTDSHLRTTAPANRLDDFCAAASGKLRELVEMANDWDVNCVLHGGDFFDNPSPGLPAAAEYLSILGGLRVPMFCIFGNHDVYAGNASTLPRTLLGFIARLGLVQLLNEGESVLREQGGIRVSLRGRSYHHAMDRRSPAEDYVVPRDSEADVTINMVHGMLMDSRDFPGELTLIDEIMETGADITLAGHNHIGFGIVQREGKYFINPGALVRMTNHRREIERQVAAALIDLDGGAVKCRLLPLRSALPGDEVLDRSKVEENANRLIMLDRFTMEVKQAADLRRWDVVGLINELAGREGIDDRVRLEALNRVGKAMEIIKSREGWE